MLSADLEKTVNETARSLNNPTLPELVDALIKRKGLKPKDATRTIYVMWKKGQIELSQAHQPSTLARYFFDFDNLWFWALTTLVTLTFATVFYVNSPPLIYARYALGGIFVLLLPGTMLITALYPREEEIDSLERLALSIGLSLAIVPLVGLALNYTPWGITLTPLMLSLAVFAEAMGMAALARKFQYHKMSL